MNDKRSDTAPAKQYTYGTDVHGSVSILLDEAGEAQASYGYTAYGDSDSGLSKEKNPAYDPAGGDTTGDKGEETPGDDPLNAFPYTGKRLDPGAGTIDMACARRSGGADAFRRDPNEPCPGSGRDASEPAEIFARDLMIHPGRAFACIPITESDPRVLTRHPVAAATRR